MEIQVEKHNDFWRADCLDLPGSPPVGMGSTRELAICNLLHILLAEANSKYRTPLKIIGPEA